MQPPQALSIFPASAHVLWWITSSSLLSQNSISLYKCPIVHPPRWRTWALCESPAVSRQSILWAAKVQIAHTVGDSGQFPPQWDQVGFIWILRAALNLKLMDHFWNFPLTIFKVTKTMENKTKNGKPLDFCTTFYAFIAAFSYPWCTHLPADEYLSYCWSGTIINRDV